MRVIQEELTKADKRQILLGHISPGIALEFYLKSIEAIGMF